VDASRNKRYQDIRISVKTRSYCYSPEHKKTTTKYSSPLNIPQRRANSLTRSIAINSRASAVHCRMAARRSLIGFWHGCAQSKADPCRLATPQCGSGKRTLEHRLATTGQPRVWGDTVLMR
jgi:hypothetical protein